MDSTQIEIAFEKELERIGITKSEFYKRAGISHSTFVAKMKGNSAWKQKDKIQYSHALEAMGGDPTSIWPDIDAIRGRVQPASRVIDVENMELKNSKGKPLYENNLKSRTPRTIFIPGFDDVEFYLRSYDTALQPKYAPGNVYGLKLVNKDAILFGRLYYIVIDGFETFRILQQGKRPDAVLLVPVNPEMPTQEIYMEKINEIYSVLGMIQRF